MKMKKKEWKELPHLRRAIEDIKRILDTNIAETQKLEKIEKIIGGCRK